MSRLIKAFKTCLTVDIPGGAHIHGLVATKVASATDAPKDAADKRVKKTGRRLNVAAGSILTSSPVKSIIRGIAENPKAQRDVVQADSAPAPKRGRKPAAQKPESKRQTVKKSTARKPAANKRSA